MNLNPLFKPQAELDKHIMTKHNLKPEELLQKKVNALNCELWETVNESKIFKYWSTKRPDRDKLLEEYSDMIHFLLSIGNDLGYTEHEYTEPADYDLNSFVNGLTNLITLIPEAKYHRHIETVFNFVIKLGYQLGFTEEDVIYAYHAKHETNYARQDSGVY